MSFIHRIMLTVSFLAVASSASGMLYYSYREEKKRAVYFQEMEEKLAQGLPTFSGPYCHPDPHPKLLTRIVLVTTLTFFLLLFFKNPAWSIPTALLAVGLFPYWYIQTQRDLALAEAYQPILFDPYLLNASVFDILGGAASLCLVIVQFVWLFRRVSPRLKGRETLP